MRHHLFHALGIAALLVGCNESAPSNSPTAASVKPVAPSRPQTPVISATPTTTAEQPPKVAATQSNSTPAEQAATPAIDEGAYRIIKDEKLLDIKRSVDVHLNRRVSPVALRSIAGKIKASDPNRYERTFILYYLPDMEVDAGAWASTHFNPALKVDIFGTTIEEHGELLKEATAAPPANMVGRWMATEDTGFPGIITIVKEKNAFYKTWKFADGSEERSDLVVRTVHGQVRYSEKGRKTSDYTAVLPNGDLAHGDDEEVWAISKAVK